MKNFFCVSLIITVLFIGVFITGMRGPYEGRWKNRDKQIVVRGIEIGSLSLEAIGEDSDDSPENGPLKTSANGKVSNTLSWHMWEASSRLSNNNATFYGNWAGFADVPNQSPDTDSTEFHDPPGYQGIVNKNFSRSDTDWWEYLNLAETLKQCKAWATIDGKDMLNPRHDWWSKAEVPFDD